MEEQASSSLEDSASRPGAPIECTAADSQLQQQLDGTTFLTTTLLPRPTAWIAVYLAADDSTESSSDGDGDADTTSNQPLVALVVGSDSLPSIILNGLRQNRVCTLSVATDRERWAVKSMMASRGEKSGRPRHFERQGWNRVLLQYFFLVFLAQIMSIPNGVLKLLETSTRSRIFTCVYALSMNPRCTAADK